MRKNVYIVIVNGRPSQEGYLFYQKAREFVLSRSDKPKVISPFKFKSKNNEYEIHMMTFEEVKEGE